jgi:hypothetical protein
MKRTDAKRVGYREVTTSTGYTLKVYPVEQNMVWGAQPARPKPSVPMHTMKTATGDQSRPTKPGDPEWEAYEADKAAWEEEEEQIQDDLGLVLALRDFDYPEPLELPPHMQVGVRTGVIDWPEGPEHEVRRMAQYLRAVVVPLAEDTMEVQNAIMEQSGVPEEVTRKLRDKFQRDLEQSFRRILEDATPEDERPGDGGEDSQD